MGWIKGCSYYKNNLREKTVHWYQVRAIELKNGKVWKEQGYFWVGEE